MPEVNIDRVTRSNRNVAEIKKHREKGGSEGEMHCMSCFMVGWGGWRKGLEMISRARRPLIENVEGKEGLFGQLTRPHLMRGTEG